MMSSLLSNTIATFSGRLSVIYTTVICSGGHYGRIIYCKMYINTNICDLAKGANFFSRTINGAKNKVAKKT